jgi:hypothetical protein
MMHREIADSTVKERLRSISERTFATKMPSLGSAASHYGSMDATLSSELIDKVYFSKYPKAVEGSASALSAILLNENNVDEVRNSGGLGAVLEMLRRLNIPAESRSEHLKNLVNSLHVILIGNKAAQQRCLSNPHTLDTLLTICQHTPGRVQSQGFEILDALSKCEGGLHSMIEKNVLDTLVSADLLTKPGSRIEIRHSVANLIHRCSVVCPSAFPVEKFEAIALKPDGQTSNMDTYMEMQMLQATLCYFNWLGANDKKMDHPFSLFRYFLNTVISENFETLDHMQLIMKLVVAALRDVKQMEFMIDHNLDIVLQYIVRTDFELFRRKVKKRVNRDSVKNKKAEKGGGSKTPDQRSIGTLMAVTLIQRPAKGTNRSEDINLTIARVALNIYEGIMEHKIAIIGEIVSSGLIPALLFRVGKGVSVDKHFCKLLTRFLNNMLRKVLFEAQNVEKQRIQARLDRQEAAEAARNGTGIGSGAGSVSAESDDGASSLEGGASMDVLLEDIKREEMEETASILSHASVTSKAVKQGAKHGSTVSKFKSMISGAEIRTVSHTLHAQGVTDMFANAIINSEDNEVVADAIQALGMLTFDAVHDGIGHNLVLIGRICLLTNNRMDCFLPGISLTCSVIMHKDLTDELRDLFVTEFKVIPSLVRALRPASLLFRFNSSLFSAIARLCNHKDFYVTLKKANGISLICTEIDIRKKKMKANRRNRALASVDEDGTMALLKVMRRDWAACKIQGNYRLHLSETGFSCNKKFI